MNLAGFRWQLTHQFMFNVAYIYPDNQDELGAKLVKEYHVQSLTDCVTCHR